MVRRSAEYALMSYIQNFRYRRELDREVV